MTTSPSAAFSLAVLSFGCTLVGVSASAVETLVEEIVVTAELTPRTAADTAASVSVVSAAELARQNADHLEEVLYRLPNVNQSNGASRARFVQIRGIGERGQFREPLNPSVGLIVDGVDFSGVGGGATLFDVEQVEVLRGPQGTIYGANALAGLINVRSQQPTGSFYSRFEAGVANYGGRELGAVVSGSGLRLAVYQSQLDGFIDNTFLNDETNDQDELLVRGSGVFDVSEALELAVVLGLSDTDNGYDAFSLDNDRDSRSDEPGFDLNETVFGSVRLTADLGSTLLTASLAHADSDVDYGYDEDWTFVGFDPFEYSSTDRYLRDRQLTTAELRWSGGEQRPWTVGLYRLQQDVDLTRIYTFAAGDFDSTYEIERTAVYGEIELPVGERSRVRVGGRFENAQADYRDSDGARFSPDDNIVGFRVVGERDLSGDALGYVSVSSGYKTGGFNTDGTLPTGLREFDEELLWNLEAGFKGQLLDDRLSLATSVFWMQRRDVQVNRSLEVPQLGGATEFIDFIDNAAEGVNRGIEVSMDAALTDSLNAFVNLGWLDTKVEDLETDGDDFLDGREQAHAPSYTYHLGLDWSRDRVFARVDLQGRDSFFFSQSHNAQANSANLVNASVGVQGERWRVSLWGRNLTDEDVEVRGFRFGNDPRLIYETRTYTQLGEPRRVGLTATFEFE